VACVRAIEAHMGVTRRADQVLALMDELTMPGRTGVVRAPIDDNDSLVIALRDARDAGNHADPGDDAVKKP
jgi:hypothetical protein